ncbi:MAG: winged helix-turn-helix transcriptional regulator [Variovorax sp.]|nr:winged helix-turn-helix transcriptional regulator [Variovorax sp.]
MKGEVPPCPWGRLEDSGDDLQLEQFLSFKVVRLAHALQRTSAREYLDAQGLTVSDWRVLALVRRYGPVQFGEVAQRSSLDKAQVSRTVRNLRERGLLQAEGDAAHAQRIVLSVTPAGKRMHAQVLPRAARAQARLLRTLAPADREALWRCLHLLQEQIRADESASPTTRSPRE